LAISWWTSPQKEKEKEKKKREKRIAFDPLAISL